MIELVLSLVMLTAFALVAGAFVLWRRTGEIKNPALMIVLALIAIANVVIWSLPVGEAGSLADDPSASS